MANDNLDEEEKEVIIPRLYPAKAKRDIKGVNDTIVGIQNAFANAVESYFNILYENWTSPRGLDFYGKAKPLLNDIDSKITDFNETTISNLVAAYNRIAPYHRESSISVATGPYIKFEIKKLQEIDPSGRVGMVDTIVDLSTKDFLSNIASIKSRVSSIPSTITYYDTNGRLAGSCETRVAELHSLLDSSINKINSILGTDASDAVKQTREAKASALSTLSSRS